MKKKHNKNSTKKRKERCKKKTTKAINPETDEALFFNKNITFEIPRKLLSSQPAITRGGFRPRVALRLVTYQILVKFQ